MAEEQLTNNGARGFGAQKLRVGLLVDGDQIPAWTVWMLEQLMGTGCAEIVLVVTNAAIQKRMTFSEKLRANRGHLAYILFLKFEERLFKLNPDPFAPKSLASVIGSNIPTIEVRPEQTRFSDRFTPEDIERIRSHRPDILLRLGFKILRGEILRVPRFGVWSYHHGDNLVNRGGPACAWEVLERSPEAGSVLQILSEDLDGGMVLCRSISRTDRLSVLRNKQGVYWKTAAFVPLEVQKLHRFGADRYFEMARRRHNAHPTFYSNRLYVAPRNGQLIRSLLHNYLNHVWLKARLALCHHQWLLLYSFSKDNDMSTSLFRFKKLMPPRDRFWADPHIVVRDGRYFVFIEELLYAHGRGHISVLELRRDGSHTTPEPVLKRDYHLSYPFVFEADGELWMIPETAESRRIELYRCRRFPNEWEFAMTLMENVTAVDVTLHREPGRWWMFANIAVHPGVSTCDELFLFSAPKLLTRDWKPHPMNPVVSDASSARPAGALFRKDGKLYRPSQDCSIQYGWGMKINEVTELSEENYSERTVSKISPCWDKSLHTTHSLSFKDGLTMVDAMCYRRK